MYVALKITRFSVIVMLYLYYLISKSIFLHYSKNLYCKLWDDLYEGKKNVTERVKQTQRNEKPGPLQKVGKRRYDVTEQDALGTRRCENEVADN